ncbi:hypothetical protein [Gordonia rhizosphera]|uniref:IPT/TIG domain-containing protein n=1 Tax=Gordonia rhizosphera NBRC 16068 TaxID=1108045 RepID=K6V3U0_9ACTN|nr:hypothetical protein [Gordonia rhizosphera]GAB90768.1 hypothetical protein GORHZ_117_00320 [Gordonia rhizosphera NBRC 16068]
MADSRLTKTGVVVTIVCTIIGTLIAVATYLRSNDGSTNRSPEPPTISVGGTGTSGDGCGLAEPAEVTLSTGQAARGDQVTVFGSCFEPGERVVIRVHTTEVGSATADSDGAFVQTITVPASAPPPGFPTDISATGKQSAKTGSAPFETK